MSYVSYTIIRLLSSLYLEDVTLYVAKYKNVLVTDKRRVYINGSERANFFLLFHQNITNYLNSWKNTSTLKIWYFKYRWLNTSIGLAWLTPLYNRLLSLNPNLNSADIKNIISSYISRKWITCHKLQTCISSRLSVEKSDWEHKKR